MAEQAQYAGTGKRKTCLWRRIVPAESIKNSTPV